MKLVIKEVKDISNIYKLIFFIAVALGVFLIYFFVFYANSCSDWSCFQQALRNCDKTTLTRDDDQSVWHYKILGNAKSADACLIEVELRALKTGNIDLEQLQSKKMICTTLKSTTFFPEEDLPSCTGKLKEEIQEVMIQRMHNYLLQNLGQINDELKGI